METPKKIGRYIINGEVGRGGMAAVLRAYDPRFERTVAVKVLPRQMTHDPEFRARFEREAKTIAALEHPAIVPVYDFGEENNQPYLVMRLMPGGSLADRLRTGPIDVLETATIMRRIASALDAAHKQGIVHRDLKPGNILFDQYGEAYLADFGIVRLSDSSAALTASGGLVGTPAYMSPEQVYGDKAIDGRSDIYALGVILFQMLTGNVPFSADTPARMMMRHVMDPVPPVLAQRPDLPDACELVIQKAMAKERDNRYATARDLSNALQQISDTRRSAPAPTQRPVPTLPLQEPVSQPPVQDPVAPSPQPDPPTPIATPPATSAAVPTEMYPGSGRPRATSEPSLTVEPKSRRWLWIGAVVVALVIVGASIGGILIARNIREEEATATTVAIAAIQATEAVVAADNATSTAVSFAATTSAAAASTTAAQETTAAAAVAATETAVIEMTGTADAAANIAATTSALAAANDLATRTAAQATATAAAESTAIVVAATATQAAIPPTATPVPAGAVPPLFGPQSGELVHELDDLIESDYATVSVRDFFVRANVGNPFTTKQGRWDVGVTFRQAEVNEEMRLVIRSDGYWSLNNRSSDDDNFIHEGNVSDILDLTSVGSNEILLLATENVGYFILNGTFVQQLDLSSRSTAGDIALSTGFYTIDEQEGFSTPYDTFAVWPLDLIAGPFAGGMDHIDDNLVKAVSGDVDQQNFVAAVTFTNPYGLDFGTWDYGFTFRRASSGEQMWLVVDTDLEWNLVNRIDGEDEFLSSGALSNLNLDTGGQNKLVLIAFGERGYFLLNDTFISALNLSSRMDAGNVSAITAFFVGNEIEGNVTGYDDFAIWSLP